MVIKIRQIGLILFWKKNTKSLSLLDLVRKNIILRPLLFFLILHFHVKVYSLYRKHLLIYTVGKVYNKNFLNGQLLSITWESIEVIPKSHQEIRMVRRYLDKIMD